MKTETIKQKYWEAKHERDRLRKACLEHGRKDERTDEWYEQHEKLADARVKATRTAESLYKELQHRRKYGSRYD